MKELGIDIETYSSNDLVRGGEVCLQLPPRGNSFLRWKRERYANGGYKQEGRRHAILGLSTSHGQLTKETILWQKN